MKINKLKNNLEKIIIQLISKDYNEFLLNYFILINKLKL